MIKVGLFLKHSWFTVLSLSAVYDSVIHKYTFFFYNLFHCGLLQNIEYSSLCYTVGCCLSILYKMVCTYRPQTPSPSLSLSPPRQPQICSLCLWISTPAALFISKMGALAPAIIGTFQPEARIGDGEGGVCREKRKWKQTCSWGTCTTDLNLVT